MSRLPLVFAAVLAVLPTTAALMTGPAVAAAPAANTLTGAITADNAARLTRFIADRADKVVTLKLTIAPGTPADFKGKNYMAEADGDLFIVFKQVGEEKLQVGVPTAKVRKLGGAWVLEGQFKVEYAGMGQGTVAYILRPQ
ncbi:MAG: hypothetical protein Q7T61_03195 [Caulobacter sp.]|nr:hypothetical protein [Caulobacter sp.]